jgi:hypothetical protein
MQLEWNYLGNALIDFDITIDAIRIAMGATLLTPINKVKINKANGKEMLNLL